MIIQGNMPTRFKSSLLLLVLATCICLLMFQMKGNLGEHLLGQFKTKNTQYSNTASRLGPAKPGLGSPGDPESIRARFIQRSYLLTQMCALPRHQVATRRNSLEPKILKLADGQLNLCPIAKVGTTYTIYDMKPLRFSGQQTELKSDTPTSYILVREPYSRLLSGYIDKIVTTERWWRKFGRLIISKFRLGASENSTQCGIGVTFPEFVKYVLYSQNAGRDLNPHFQPIHQHCHICRQHFDFIGHLETFEEDFGFILKSVNINVEDFNFDHSESAIRSKCETTVRWRQRIKKCQAMCTTLRDVWWSFQARGLISKDIRLPVQGADCDSISGAEFTELALRAHKASLGKMTTREQKRSFLVELFTQVPLQDRLLLREVFMADFELFGYDSMPPDLFPEIHQQNRNS